MNCSRRNEDVMDVSFFMCPDCGKFGTPGEPCACAFPAPPHVPSCKHGQRGGSRVCAMCLRVQLESALIEIERWKLTESNRLDYDELKAEVEMLRAEAAEKR